MKSLILNIPQKVEITSHLVYSLQKDKYGVKVNKNKCTIPDSESDQLYFVDYDDVLPEITDESLSKKYKNFIKFVYWYQDEEAEGIDCLINDYADLLFPVLVQHLRLNPGYEQLTIEFQKLDICMLSKKYHFFY